MQFNEITARDITENTFRLINERWTLVTAGDETGYNTMTASWGGVGTLWGKDVAFIFVRPQRYTYEFMEKGGRFTLGFFPEVYRPQLNLCGSKSGREIDKAAQCGFTAAFCEGAPYFTQADLVLVCKKMYAQDLSPECVIDPGIEKWYQNDYHRMYVGEIVKVLKKDESC